MELSQDKKYLLFILLILAFIAATRLYPLFRFSEAGLGYDTGFYRRYIEIEPKSFLKPPSFLLEKEAVTSRFTLSVLSLSGLNTNIALFGSYLAFSLLLSLAIYALASRIFASKTAGIFSLLLFALSPVQWLAYTFMLYKNFLAAWLLFFAFYFAEAKKTFFILPLILTIISHRTTALLAGGSSLLWGAFEFIKTKRYLMFIALFGILAFAAFLNWQTIKNLLEILLRGFPDSDPYGLRSGIFVYVRHYLSLSFPYLLTGIAGAAFLAKKKLFGAFFFFFIICAALVLTKSYFYQRILVYLDLSLIILAGGALAVFWEKFKNQKLAVFATLVFLSLIATALFFTIRYYEPMILKDELSEIKKLQGVENHAFVMTYAPKYAPWLYGWAGPDKRVISPGLFWDRWNEARWNEFWRADIEKQKEMMAIYQAPLYIFSPGSNYSSDPCFERFSDMIWKFTCF